VFTFRQEVAPIAEKMISQYVNAREPVPEKYIAPELILGLDLYLGAFFDLDGERTHVDTVTRIKLSQIEDYAERYCFSERQTEEVIYFVRAIDKVHCDRLAEARQKDSKTEAREQKWKTRK